MADRRVGRALIGSAILLIIFIGLSALSRAPLFGLEWLYTSGARLMIIAWDVSPALCLLTIALAGGTVGHRLAMREVADQLVRERWSRKCRSTLPDDQPEIYLKPVRLAIAPPAQPRAVDRE